MPAKYGKVVNSKGVKYGGGAKAPAKQKVAKEQNWQPTPQPQVAQQPTPQPSIGQQIVSGAKQAWQPYENMIKPGGQIQQIVQGLPPYLLDMLAQNSQNAQVQNPNVQNDWFMDFLKWLQGKGQYQGQ